MQRARATLVGGPSTESSPPLPGPHFE